MKIKCYKKCKNNKYQIFFVGNKENIHLYDDIILKFNLLLKKEITEKEIQELVKENDKLECFYKAIKYLSIRNRCKKEIKEYLKRNNFSDKEIEHTIMLLEEKKLINREEYLRAFIDDQISLTKNGPQKITQKLISLDYEEAEIKAYLDTIDQNIWQEKLESLIAKKEKNTKKESSNKKRERILYSCIQEGYNREDIIPILKNLNFEEDNEFLEKEALKLYNKLAKKYQEPNLSYQVKARLINKGFNYSNIENALENIKKTSS